MVSVTVSVTIAVAVTVAVAIFVVSTMAVCAVEYNGKIFKAFFLVDVLQFVEHVAGKQAGAHDKEGAVGKILNNLCVGNDINRGAVDEDV